MTPITNTPSFHKQLATVLQSLIESAKSTGHWMTGQIPDVLHELIIWTIFMGAINLVFMIALIIGCYFLLTKFSFVERYDEYVRVLVSVFILMFVAAYILGGGIPSVLHACQALIVPKLYLLQYAIHLLHR